MTSSNAMRRLLVTMLVTLAVAVVAPATAAAHAVLQSSSPAANASVPTSPPRILLTFSEAPDAKLSLIRVIDAQGVTVPGVSAPQVVPGDKLSLQVVPANPLSAGTYTVNYRTVSSVDGHVQTGAFAFGVGQAAGRAVVVQLVHRSAWGSALTDAGRWMLYVALALLIGAASTCIFVYAGVVPKGGVAVLWVAVAAAMVALSLLVWGEKLLVGAPSLLPLFETREGQFLLALAVALVLCICAVALVDLWPGRWSLWLVGIAAAAAALVHVAAGHPATGSLWPLNIGVQWVHMSAVGVWVGGLFWLLLGIRGRDRQERAAAVGAFTRIATWTLVVVLATGLVRGVEEVGSPQALFCTSYGIALLVKIILVAGLVGLGALNHFFWVPAVRGAGGEAAGRRFGLNSRGELAVALVVLASTAVLTGLIPARTAEAVKSAPAGGAAAGVTAGGVDYGTTVRVRLSVTPCVAGRNAYVVTVESYDSGEPLASATRVAIRFALPSQPTLGSSQLALRRTAPGRWEGSGLELSVVGRWQTTVTVQEATGGVSVPLQVYVKASP
jgi:copper transport protein